jgi:hypothetical protein
MTARGAATYEQIQGIIKLHTHPKHNATPEKKHITQTNTVHRVRECKNQKTKSMKHLKPVVRLRWRNSESYKAHPQKLREKNSGRHDNSSTLWNPICTMTTAKSSPMLQTARQRQLERSHQ